MTTMTKRTEGLFKGHSGSELFYQTWTVEKPRATLVVTHGLSEHSDSYARFADAMNEFGYSVIAWDLQGHGRSEGRRGYIDNFSSYSKDFESFMRFLRSGPRAVELLQTPMVFVGHSMGGLVTLKALMDYGLMGAKAICLSSPLLGVAVEVPFIKDFAAKALYRILPQITMGNEIDFAHLTHDPDVIAGMKRDALRHDRVSPPLYIGMLENCQAIRAGVKEIECPVLMQLAGDDRVVSRTAAEVFYDHLVAPKKKLIVYEGLFHEIFNEVERKQVYSDLNTFLKDVV